MTTTKFQVGDKVRVVSERPKDGDSQTGPFWIEEMDRLLGTPGEVVWADGGHADVVVAGDRFTFRDHWLVPAIPTQRVRIAVCIDSDGNWVASGWSGGSEKQLASSAEDYHGLLDDGTYLRVVHWVEADVPVPAAAVVEGRVVTDGGEMPTHDLGEPVG